MMRPSTDGHVQTLGDYINAFDMRIQQFREYGWQGYCYLTNPCHVAGQGLDLVVGQGACAFARKREGEGGGLLG